MTAQQTENAETAVTIPAAAATQNRLSRADRSAYDPYTGKHDTFLDEEAPAYTIIDTPVERNVKRQRTACGGCMPERNAVVAIFSLYFFFGVVYTAVALVGIAYDGSAYDKLVSVANFLLSAALTTAGLFGMKVVSTENAKKMHRLAIMVVVLTVAKLSIGLIDYVHFIVTRDDAVDRCNEYKQDYARINGVVLNVDCSRAVQNQLIRDGLNLFLVETILVYFAYIVFRYSTHLKRKAKSPLPSIGDGRHVNSIPPTYAVYGASAPTANDWIPPPVYSGNPNHIPLAEKEGDAETTEGTDRTNNRA
jgi:hypothetical protein